MDPEPESPASASVLVVDDTQVNRLVLETQLAQHGYRVTCAENGREALELLPTEAEPGDPGDDEFDVVVLDIMMPEIDGLQVLEELRKVRGPIQLPVIMATAKDQSEDIVEALAAGANDYVTKPIDTSVLLARLEAHLELKRSHEALRGAQRALIQAAKMETLGHLAAGVAHEIRNPLAQIQLAADGLARLEPGADKEMAKTFSELLTQGVERADAIVCRLMDSASSRFELRNCDLNLLVEETLGMLGEDIAQCGATVVRRFGSSLAPVSVAREELQQALINILLNSLQAMPEGGQVAVATGTRVVEGLPPDDGTRSGRHLRNGDEACAVEVLDTGPGIPPEDIDAVFDAFFTTKPTGSGTGLGLTVAKKIVELHDGILEVANREDVQGTRVSILLPAVGALTTTV